MSHSFSLYSDTNAEVYQIPCAKDNYAYVVSFPKVNKVICIDPGFNQPVEDFFHNSGLAPTDILITHKHSDHVGGISSLTSKWDLSVWAPYTEIQSIPCVTHTLTAGEEVSVGEALSVQVIGTPGHTKGHLSFFISLSESGRFLFCGDALFSYGCGRMFEGNAKEFYQGLMRLMDFPDNTLVCCGHEYSESNIRFGLSVDPENTELIKRSDELKAGKKKFVPTQLKDEKNGNPFLRVDTPSIRKNLLDESMKRSSEEIFGILRLKKDDF